MPRFVILEHTGSESYKPGRHWDLMLEMDGRLTTWELESIPAIGAPSLCRALPNHRLMYLDYEGPLSDNRGVVRRWDAGEYQMQCNGQGQLTALLSGQRLVGKLRISPDPADSNLTIASLFGESE